MKKQKLIAFTGLRRSGKDTAAAVLVKEGWELIKFADGLKGMLRTYLEYVGANANEIHAMLEGDLKETPNDFFLGSTPRWAMQSLGTEWGRRLINDNLWISAAMKHARHFDKVVISDCRFTNEAMTVVENGGLLVRVTRAGLAADAHPSESGINTLPYNFSIDNNGTVDELQQKVLQLISTI